MRLMRILPCLAVALALPAVSHAAVIQITLGDFINPVVLDFESAPLGPISPSDPIFTSAGN